jgi:hypothetical protein
MKHQYSLADLLLQRPGMVARNVYVGFVVEAVVI